MWEGDLDIHTFGFLGDPTLKISDVMNKTSVGVKQNHKLIKNLIKMLC